MSPRAPISVAISTLDRPESLDRCLRALLRGERVPAEITVVDQSSGPDSRSVVEALPPVTTVRYVAQSSRGLATAQNEAVRSSREPIVAVTDDDCIPDPRWIAVLERVFADDDAPDVVTGRVLPLPPDGERTAPVSTRTDERRHVFRGAVMPWSVGSGNNFALRRDWYLRVGGCDERLGPGSPGLGGVDMDLFHRLLRSGATIRYEPDSLVLHERQTDDGRWARRWMYGHGMGASAALRLRDGDSRAFPLLARWIGFRLRRLAKAAVFLDVRRFGEEVIVIGGTARGVIYGSRASDTRGSR